MALTSDEQKEIRAIRRRAVRTVEFCDSLLDKQEPEPTPNAISGTGAVLKQDLMTSVEDSLALWQNINPNRPERLTHYATGGDLTPLIDGSVNESYIKATILEGDMGPNESGKDRLHIGANPREPSTFENTFAGLQYGSSYVIYFSTLLYDPPDGWPEKEWSQIMQVHHDFSCSKSPPLAITEQPAGDKTALRLISRPFGSGTDRQNYVLGEYPRGVWIRFALAVRMSRTADGYAELWEHQGTGWMKRWERTAPTVLQESCGDNSQITWGPYSDASVPNPRSIATANWQVCEWTRP